MLLKMALPTKLLLALLMLCSPFAFAQKPDTVFTTYSDPNEKEAKPQPYFLQVSLSIPIRANPYSTDETYNDNGTVNDPENKPTVLDYIIPDGLGAHIGYGLQLKSWVGISANTGIDWMASEQLVSAPVYGSIFFNPQIWEEYNITLQAGVGKAFALGRGNLSGTYQKYRLGFIQDNHGSLYLEANSYDFPIHGRGSAGNISIGLSLFDFL